jgi:carboxyl-terminal processing protease
MNIKSNWRRFAYSSAFVLLAGFSSCKQSEFTNPDLNIPPSTGEREELTKDSIFLYAKQVYLWNTELPNYDTFKPRSFVAGTDLNAYEAELFAITRYGTNKDTGKPYELNPEDEDYPKYSYISDAENQNPIAMIAPKGAVNTDGVGYDFGIFSLLPYGNDNNYRLYIKAVYPGSSAAKLGLTRGAEITTINGRRIGTNFNGEVNLINSLLDNELSSAVIKGFKVDGTSFEETLTRTSYNSSPVYKDKIFELNGKKVGYIALGRFSQLTSPGGSSPSDTNLDPVFAKFAAAGLTDLIVDLRYNGGGYVSTAEYLINLIAPSTATGVMYREVYNTMMQTKKATILKNQPLTDEDGKIRYGTDGKMLTYANVSYSIGDNTAEFSKKGGLTGVKNVVFIVSGNTASASELTINALKPFVNVKLVGEQTYGKPVGFFPVTIENRYDVYFSMFETRNSKNEGGYYAGFKPDIVSSLDDASHDFDNPLENYVARSLELLAPGTATNARASMSVKGKGSVNLTASPTMSTKLKSRPIFVGMIENRHTVK